MLVSSASAATRNPIPVRAFNVFFGLGIPAPLQKEGYEGVLEPLGQHRDKLLIMRGVDHVRADQSGVNAHFDGSSAAFTAEGGSRVDVAGLRAFLSRMGFAQAPTAVEPGDYAGRGGIIDNFPPGQPGPVRLDRFGCVLDGARRV